MWFKNLLVYRVGETRLKKDDLAEKLKDNALQPCGSFEMLSRGWMAPREAAGYLARHLEERDAPVLDAGAGTGLVGQALASHGFAHIEALDLSATMLEV